MEETTFVLRQVRREQTWKIACTDRACLCKNDYSCYFLVKHTHDCCYLVSLMGIVTFCLIGLNLDFLYFVLEITQYALPCKFMKVFYVWEKAVSF